MHFPTLYDSRHRAAGGAGSLSKDSPVVGMASPSRRQESFALGGTRTAQGAAQDAVQGEVEDIVDCEVETLLSSG